MALTTAHPALKIHLVPCLQDNYAAIIECSNQQAIVVDPSESQPVLDFLKARGLNLAAILNTHHHHDHIGGNGELKKHFPCRVYGFAGDRHRIQLDVELSDNQIFSVLECQFRVMHIPGHTLGHIAFILNEEDAVFCGDTLFSLGCGRLFEGTPEQMCASLLKLGALRPDCLVYCGHEYTFSNLRFVQALAERDHVDTTNLEKNLQARLNTTHSTLPSTIGFENQHNPFLQACHRGVASFKTMREQKDHFHV